jgi:hypothetical protein
MNRLFFIFFPVIFYASCSSSKQAEVAEDATALPPQYYYYPKANVYFDSANKTYFFQSGDSLNWQSAQQIPAVVMALMDKNVFIADAQEPVWQNNDNHRLVYSAVLYATPNDTLQKKVVRTVKKTTVVPVDSAALAEKKPRKGINGLFDKLFGRNKKKKELEKADSGKRSR